VTAPLANVVSLGVSDVGNYFEIASAGLDNAIVAAARRAAGAR
jgi:hypothetical protein